MYTTEPEGDQTVFCYDIKALTHQLVWHLDWQDIKEIIVVSLLKSFFLTKRSK